MKFDYVIGNPPYQDGESESTRKPPVYNLFMDASYSVSDKVELITPARFLFDAGQTPKSWNKKMLNDNHLKVLYFEADGSKVFPNTNIMGGIVVTYWDKSKNFGAIKAFTPYKELNQTLRKVINKSDKSLDSIISQRGCYRLTSNFFADFPDASKRMGAGSGNMVVSNIFDKIPEAFLEQIPEDENEYIKLMGRAKNARAYRYIKSNYLVKNEFLEKYNVFVPEANGSGAIGEVESTIVIGAPTLGTANVGHTDTFLSIGKFDKETDAQNCLKYVKSKFARTMLGILKVTQHNPPSAWKYVPLQDFTAHSDIDWSKSVAEIDQQLYKKYELSAEEIDFIETHVKEMA